MMFKVNAALLPIKAHFFFFFAALAPILPFLPIYAKQLGIDTVGVGVVFAALPIIGNLAKPVAGWIADRFSKHKAVFLTGLVLTGCGYFSLQFVPGVSPDLESSLDCSSPWSLIKICRSQSDWAQLEPHLPPACPVTCSLKCVLTYQPQICSSFNLANCSGDSVVEFSIQSDLRRHSDQVNPGCLYLPIDSTWTDGDAVKPVCAVKTSLKCEAQCDEEHIQSFIRQDSVFESPMFWAFFLINILAYSGNCVVTSMGDAIAFSLLGDKHEQYGAQRVWGSIGWGLFTIITGFLVDSSSESTTKNFFPAFMLLGSLLLLNLIVTAWSLRITDTGNTALVFSDIFKLLAQFKVLLFVCWCVLCGLLTSLIWVYLPWYLSDMASGSGSESRDTVTNDTCGPRDTGTDTEHWMTLLLGLNMGIQCFVGEVPMFFLSGWLIRTLGHSNTMTLVLAAFGARLLLYSVLTNPWFSLMVEVLNGITFGIFYSTMTSYAHLISPPGFESTMQGLVGAAFEGVGVSVGSLLGGVIFKVWGGRLLFRASGALSLICCGLHGLIQLLAIRCRQQEESNERPGFSKVPTRDREDAEKQ